MSTSVTLPALGESVTEGTVSRWLKQVGDTVEADEPLLEVSTDKVDTEIPSPAAGVLLEIRAQEDETVEIGAVLAVIGDASEAEGGAAADSGGDSGADAAAESEPEQAEPAPVEPEPEPTSAADADKMAAAEQEAAPAPAASSDGAADDGAASGGAASGTEVTLPALGESVTEGTVSRWLKQVGDQVETDEPLLEVSTDKVDTEIPAPTSGTLLEIRVQEDETVEIGAVLAVIGEQAGAAQAQPEPQTEAQPEPEPEPEAEAGARARARARAAPRS